MDHARFIFVELQVSNIGSHIMITLVFCQESKLESAVSEPVL